MLFLPGINYVLFALQHVLGIFDWQIIEDFLADEGDKIKIFMRMVMYLLRGRCANRTQDAIADGDINLKGYYSIQNFPSSFDVCSYLLNYYDHPNFLLPNKKRHPWSAKRIHPAMHMWIQTTLNWTQTGPNWIPNPSTLFFIQFLLSDSKCTVSTLISTHGTTILSPWSPSFWARVRSISFSRRKIFAWSWLRWGR